MKYRAIAFCLFASLAGCTTPQQSNSEDPVLADKLRSVVIPEMEFHDAIVDCPVTFCQEVYSKRYSPAIRNGQQLPRVIICEDIPEEVALNLPRINISVKNISLYDAVKLIAKQTGLGVELKNGIVSFKCCRPR